MKAILEFDPVEEGVELEDAMNATEYRVCIESIYDSIAYLEKHTDRNPQDMETALENIKQSIIELNMPTI